MTVEPRAWLTRSGRAGERDQWALDSQVTPGGFGKVPDLSKCGSLNDVKALVALAYPDHKPGAITNFSAQLWALRGRMEAGDLVVLPLKTTSQLAIGRITGAYEYRDGEAEPARRHVRTVTWLRTDVARTQVKQDLLFSLGAFSTYCEVSRNEAVQRITAIAQTGKDPGTSAASITKTTKASAGSASDGLEELDADDSSVDLGQFAKDRIEQLTRENFAGHRMAELTEAILAAQGYTCWRAPEGADGGIDILAGSGPLGLDSPRLVVQVKSEQSAVGDPVISQLLGTMSKHGQSAQGLLVAWGGLTPPARKSARDNYFRLRVWEAADVIDQVTRHYEALSEEIRADLPLKRIWIAVEEEA